MELTLALAFAAATVGALHTVAPDHWVPFAALARAERWSAARTALVTGLCGLGHVTASAALGLAAAFLGLELVQRVGQRLEAVAGVLLIAFGVVYGLWGLHRRLGEGWHDHGEGRPHWHHHHHAHRHDHTGARERRMTAWTLFVLFSADPCVAVIPLMFAAAPLGWRQTLAVVAAYELATIGTMIALVLPARAAAAAVGGAWADRYGDALAGAAIAMVGVVVVSLGW